MKHTRATLIPTKILSGRGWEEAGQGLDEEGTPLPAGPRQVTPTSLCCHFLGQGKEWARAIQHWGLLIHYADENSADSALNLLAK